MAKNTETMTIVSETMPENMETMLENMETKTIVSETMPENMETMGIVSITLKDKALLLLQNKASRLQDKPLVLKQILRFSGKFSEQLATYFGVLQYKQSEKSPELQKISVLRGRCFYKL